MKRRRFNSVIGAGFTLVELLIVIVVIAILASITIVSYSGTTKSAKAISIIDGVRQYNDAIAVYRATYGSYPKTSAEIAGNPIALTCLGTGYQNQTCGTVTGVQVYEDSTFNTAMQSLISGTPPAIGKDLIAVQGETFVGAVYGIDTTTHSSTGYARVIEYAIQGTGQDCKLPKAWSYSVNTNPPAFTCEIVLEEVPSP